MERSSKIKDFWDTKNHRFFSASTTRIARNKDAKGFGPNRLAAREGGKVAGIARKELEKRSGQQVVSRQNYLAQSEKEKRKKILN